MLDTLYAPTRLTDAPGDELPVEVFGPEDAERALEAATALLAWARGCWGEWAIVLRLSTGKKPQQRACPAIQLPI